VFNDGTDVVQELVGGAPAAYILTGLAVDERFTRTQSGSPHGFLADGLGSTLALADSGGGLSTQYTYAAFGGTTDTGTTNSSPYRYTGREEVGSSGEPLLLQSPLLQRQLPSVLE
jgi:uncharacterized protein RhaS with RHS repeats